MSIFAQHLQQQSGTFQNQSDPFFHCQPGEKLQLKAYLALFIVVSHLEDSAFHSSIIPPVGRTRNRGIGALTSIH